MSYDYNITCLPIRVLFKQDNSTVVIFYLLLFQFFPPGAAGSNKPSPLT